MVTDCGVGGWISPAGRKWRELTGATYNYKCIPLNVNNLPSLLKKKKKKKREELHHEEPVYLGTEQQYFNVLSSLIFNIIMNTHPHTYKQWCKSTPTFTEIFGTKTTSSHWRLPWPKREILPAILHTTLWNIVHNVHSTENAPFYSDCQSLLIAELAAVVSWYSGGNKQTEIGIHMLPMLSQMFITD